MSTFGPAYDKAVDEPALTDQRNRIKDFMVDGTWHSLAEIAERLGYPEASVSAQLRHLRKAEFGSWKVEKKRREGCRIWMYRVSPQDPTGQLTFA